MSMAAKTPHAKLEMEDVPGPSLHEAALTLARKLEETVGSTCEEEGTEIYRVETAIEAPPLMPWLQGQEVFPKVYCSARDEHAQVAGIGAAHQITHHGAGAFRRVTEAIASHLRAAPPALRYYGGFSFSDDRPLPEEWKDFGNAFFFVPRIEIVERHDAAVLACNVVIQDGADKGSLINGYVDQLEKISGQEDHSLPPLPKMLTRKDTPDYEGWVHGVETALARVKSGPLEKVVLARQLFAEYSHTLDPFSVLQELWENTINSYHYCVQPTGRAAFVGGSPERLYAREGSRIQSEALAGTRARGESPESDDGLGKELLESEKEIREHAFVLQHIREIFESLCVEVRVAGAVELRKLRWVQHLHCAIEGTLKEGVSDTDILQALHPTPAVGGCPTGEALRTIEELEPFERGWYAAPVGWIGREGAEFAVAIRSALVRGSTLTLWTGDGIVPGSTPESEWKELEVKTTNFMSVLKG